MTSDLPPGSQDADTTVESAPATSPVGIPRIGVTPAVPTQQPSPAPSRSRSTTLLVDAAPHRLRRTEDLLDLVLAAIGSASMLILAAYAHETTTGVTLDVQNALAAVLRQILVFPLQTVEGLATFLVPVSVVLASLLRRSWRTAGQAILGGIGGFLLAWAVLAAVTSWAPSAIISGLTVTASGTAKVGISTVFATLAGLLTGAGERRVSHAVRRGWTALWVIIGLAVLRSALTLPGAVMSVLLGRVLGLAIRYGFGVEDRRAHGTALVRALRRAGIDAVRVVRMDRAPAAKAWTVVTDTPVGYTEQVRENPLTIPAAMPDLDDAGPRLDLTEYPNEPAEVAAALHPEETATITTATDVDLEAIVTEASSAALTVGRPSVHRLYAVWDATGIRRDVTVLDTDSQVAGFVSTLWDRIRIKGLSPERDLSVRSAAEHAALMTLEAHRARVRTPALFGMAEADESVLLVADHVIGARALGDLDEVSDDVLAQLWEQLGRAHAAGLAHRAIDSSSVVVDVAGCVWLLDWDSGETISSELSRRVDLAQTLALTASVVGVDRAIAAASRSLSTPQIASIAPMLQRVVLPATTRDALGEQRGRLLQELRDALVALTPTAHAEPAKLTRFSPRTVVMAVVGLVALWTLLARMNFSQISAAVAAANAWWILGAVVFSLATYLGAGIALVAFSPVRLSVWKSTEVHLAGAVVSLVAPAGVGGAAINLRFLTRRGVPTAIGVATVARPGRPVPRHDCSAHHPGCDDGAVHRVDPALGLARPGCHRARGHGRLGAVRAPGAHLGAGQDRAHVSAGVAAPGVDHVEPAAPGAGRGGHRPAQPELRPRLRRKPVGLRVHAITYLASNTVGSVVPSPGGIGPVEIALTAGLVTAGIPSGVALSAAIVYRLVTFWIPIPAGWLSLRHLQRSRDL